MPRLTLTIALLVSVIPSFGMAGVIVKAIECVPSVSAASWDSDETPAPDSNPQFKTARNMSGMGSNSVTMISSSSNGVGGWPVLFVKAIPPVESIYDLSEWRFIPEIPVSKIPKVPIG